ncbi:2Fe-2S iron-sulfur cluster binding domain-containing protein [Bacillus songklensis]|uniref:2Fe-2S iron-sulfur cluster binding domain-containing protein n=1 Tax=Bacillus songklensis TaxID=1069116 RepID=A0ABV8B5L0_9BACI
MFTVKVMDYNEGNPELSCHDSESLLDAANKRGIKIPYACKGGGCGMCKIKVEEGDFERGPSSKEVLPDAERTMNYTLACKTYPKSDMKILIDMSKFIHSS